MHKLDVAFCDTNETYGERFAAYLMEHKAKEFTVHLFPEPELFLQKIKNEKFDLVLLGSGFSEFGEQAVLSGMTVLILSENIPERLSEDNSYLQSGRKLTVIFIKGCCRNFSVTLQNGKHILSVRSIQTIFLQ